MSARTKSERLRRLVSHGYFAPELPPCFVSDDLARYRTVVLRDIDRLPLNPRNNPNHYSFISEPAWFYFPRFGKEDRRHGTPNPIAHLLIARTLAHNYVDLRRKARASKLTLSPPVFDWNGSRALMRPTIDLRDAFRVDLASRRESYVAADLRAFFHSIYTHAIPWAIHGKKFAKQNRGFSHYGNVIDLLCRNAQDGQTLGLPVGPDTSRLIAELVASAIDVRLQERLKLGSRDASRYIDDYTLSSGGGEAGEALLAALRQAAAEFELELAGDKSGIFPTSHRQATGWQQMARSIVPSGVTDDADLQLYFYQLGALCGEHPELNIEKFSLQNARVALLRAENWPAVQANLISAYRRNPSLVSLLVEVCLLRQVMEGDVRGADLKEFIENRIPVLAQANRTGEIIWLLFLAIRLRLSLATKPLAPLYEIENAFIALLVSCLASGALVEGAVDRRLWNQSLNAGGLRSPMWLYAYEAVTRGLVPGQTDDFITAEPYFRLLRARQVQFLDLGRGYASLATTLRSRRGENERLRRLRQAMEEDGEEDLDDVYDPDDEDDDSISEFDDDMY